MKKVLLLSGLFTGFFATAQTITVDDTLFTGLSTDYYIMDSAAVDLSAVVGTGVTWNYSSITAYQNATTPDMIIDASTSPYAANFPTADYNDDLSTGASLFFNNSLDSVTVLGYVFTADGTEIIIRHSTDPLKALEFPMSVSDTYTDAIEGEADIMGTIFPTTGTATVTVDGFGTLNVSGNTHTNILRIKLVEVIDASITVPFPVSGTVTRSVYSYYDLTNDQQAIFVHATIIVDSDVLNDDYSAVYYSGTPNYFLGIDNEIVNTLSIYPNPATNVVNVITDGTAESISVINSLGQVVLTISNPQQTETIDASKLNSGIYVVQINNDGILTDQKLVVE